MKEVSIGGDGSTDVVEQVACIHWWPCSGLGVPHKGATIGGGPNAAC